MDEYLREVYPEGVDSDLRTQLECVFLIGAASALDSSNRAEVKAELLAWNETNKVKFNIGRARFFVPSGGRA